MNYKVSTISVFERQAKRLIKKFPSLKEEIQILVNKLKETPTQGIPIGFDCFKIRLAIKSKGRGKSGGARLITNLVYKNKEVFLLTIYDKSETENISDNELLELLKLIP